MTRQRREKALGSMPKVGMGKRETSDSNRPKGTRFRDKGRVEVKAPKLEAEKDFNWKRRPRKKEREQRGEKGREGGGGG